MDSISQTLFIDQKTTAWIVFSQSAHRLFGSMLKANYSHCYVIIKDEYNVIKLNPSQTFLITEILPVQAKDFAIYDWTQRTDHVIKLEFYPRTSKKHFGIFGLRTCVSLCKYFLGLRKLRAITPRGLYKELLQLNCTKRNIMGIKNIQRIC